MPGRRVTRVADVTRGFAGSFTTKALPALLLNGLARTSGVAALPMAMAALRLTFPNRAPHPRPPFGELTGTQQRAMRTLANLTWRQALRTIDHMASRDSRLGSADGTPKQHLVATVFDYSNISEGK